MKTSILSLFLALAFSGFTATADILPIEGFDNLASITVDDTGITLNGSPRVLESCYLNLTGYNIAGYRISEDSLIIDGVQDGGPGPILDAMMPPIWIPTGDTTIRFSTSGIYRVFVSYSVLQPYVTADIGVPIDNLTPAGSFRLLPNYTTQPAYPLTSDSVKLKMTLGEMFESCFPRYSASAHLNAADSTIYLTYSESVISLDPPCMILDSAITYGPEFNLGLLSAGSYQVRVNIPQDTGSYLLGSIAVSGMIEVRGTVTTMPNPLLECAGINCNFSPIKNARISAVAYDPCFFGLNAESLFTTSDSTGAFFMELPDNGTVFILTAEADGYYAQSLLTSRLARTKGLPPQISPAFELIDVEKTPQTSITVNVTMGGAPVESASVSLETDFAFAICPLYTTDLAKPAPGSGNIQFGGYTDKQGRFQADSAYLEPAIDYNYSVYKGSKNVSGIIRLNVYTPYVLDIDLSPVALEDTVPAAGDASWLTVSPTPFNPSTVIRFSKPAQSARLVIYDIQGRSMAEFKNLSSQSVTWNAGHAASGVYLVKLTSGKKTLTKKILLQK